MTPHHNSPPYRIGGDFGPLNTSADRQPIKEGRVRSDERTPPVGPNCSSYFNDIVDINTKSHQKQWWYSMMFKRPFALSFHLPSRVACFFACFGSVFLYFLKINLLNLYMEFNVNKSDVSAIVWSSFHVVALFNTNADDRPPIKEGGVRLMNELWDPKQWVGSQLF